MSFTLQLFFEGLLYYVPNDDTKKICRLCVVLPKAAGHTGRVYAGTDTTLGTADPDGVAIDGLRAVLQFDPITSDFDFDGPSIGGNPKCVIPLDGIIGSAADKNDDIVAATLTPQAKLSVRSQFLISTGGIFQGQSSADPPNIELPANSLNNQTSQSFDFSEAFLMHVDSVNSARLIIFSLEDSTTPLARYEITTTSGTASLTLSHTCFATGTPHATPFSDEDFRFHYMLLTALPSGFPTLAQMPKPIIQKFSGKTPNFKSLDRPIIKPDGCDCAGARATPRTYDLDKFMNVT